MVLLEREPGIEGPELPPRALRAEEKHLVLLVVEVAREVAALASHFRRRTPRTERPPAVAPRSPRTHRSGGITRHGPAAHAGAETVTARMAKRNPKNEGGGCGLRLLHQASGVRSATEHAWLETLTVSPAALRASPVLVLSEATP